MGSIIFNQTVQVEKGIAGDWLHWIINEHAPQIVATECFTKFTVLKLLQQDDTETSTYAIQFYATDMIHYQRYEVAFAKGFTQNSFSKWGNKFFTFSTVMEVMH